MNRLELVNRLISEAGVTNLVLGTTVNQRGEALQFVNWIDDAWQEVAGLHNWPSLWEQAQITVMAGQSTRAQSVAHPRYEKDTGFIGTTLLEYLPWADFRKTYPVVRSGNPAVWTIRPDRSLALNAIVEADTVVSVERYKAPARFLADADAPGLFEEHHMMIVWRGLMFYGGFDEASVAYKRGASEYALMKRLAAGDLPTMELGEPLL